MQQARRRELKIWREDRETVLAASARVSAALWQRALEAAEEDPNPVSTGLFIQALNNLLDSYEARDAALDRHVPEVVLFLLFITFIMTASLVGYSSAIANHRASFATYILLALIIALVFIVIDLDRPRRGLIEVSQHLLELEAATEARQ